jgi:hypothetical protein
MFYDDEAGDDMGGAATSMPADDEDGDKKDMGAPSEGGEGMSGGSAM